MSLPSGVIPRKYNQSLEFCGTLCTCKESVDMKPVRVVWFLLLVCAIIRIMDIKFVSINAGVSKRDAQLLFIHEVYQNEFYGVVYVSSIMSDGQDVILAVGAKCVHIYNSRMTCIKK